MKMAAQIRGENCQSLNDNNKDDFKIIYFSNNYVYVDT